DRPGHADLTAIDASRVYGAANPTFTSTVTGFVNGDTAGVLSGAAALTTTATVNSGVGTYPIMAGVGTLSAANYTFGFKNGTLKVTPTTLTVTANGASRVYGSANPVFSATLTGFVNGDTASVVSGAARLTSPATAGTGVGTYPINAALGSLTAGNYT